VHLETGSSHQHTVSALCMKSVYPYCKIWTALILSIQVTVDEINHNMWPEKPKALKTIFLMFRLLKSPLTIRRSRVCRDFFCQAHYSNPEGVPIRPISEITIANVTSFRGGCTAFSTLVILLSLQNIILFSSLVCLWELQNVDEPSAGRVCRKKGRKLLSNEQKK
jgi:hypothetical protein